MSGHTSIAPWRRRLRFKVRALAVLVLLIAAGLGLVVNRARVQRAAVAAIRKTGGNVVYDWQYKNGRPFPQGQIGWPDWLVDPLGVDYFGNVLFVFLPEGGSDDVMVQIGRLNRVKILWVRSPNVTDVGLANLKHLSYLEQAMFANCPIDDAGLIILKRLPNLHYLSFHNTRVSATGANDLRKALPMAKVDF